MFRDSDDSEEIQLNIEIELNAKYYIISNRLKKKKTIDYIIEDNYKKYKNIYLNINNYIIDKKWLKNIINIYKNKDIKLIEKENNYFALFYTLIYLRENTTEYILMLKKLKEFFKTDDLIDCLITFLNKNNYKIYYNYSCTSYLNRSNFKLLSRKRTIIIKYYVRRLLIYIYRFFVKKCKQVLICFNKFKNIRRSCYLENIKGFKNCSKLKVLNSASSCIFYYAENNNGDKLFIKDCEIKYLDSIKREKLASKYLKEKINNENNYLFDLANENDNYFILPFMKSLTLNSYIEKNKIDMKFIFSLIKFCENVLDELYLVKIVHRDIRPENIIVILTGSKVSFKLIDFGCSIQLDNMEIMNNPIFKYDFYTAGIDYKAGVNVWDDAGSFYIMCKNIIKKTNCLDDRILENIVKKIGRIYYLE